MSLTMWWPSPEAFDDLIVEDAENGFDLSAPDKTECGQWLGYWNQSEEHQKFFTSEFTKVLLEYANQTLEQHGKAEAIPDQQSGDRAETQEDVAGPLP